MEGRGIGKVEGGERAEGLGKEERIRDSIGGECLRGGRSGRFF